MEASAIADYGPVARRRIFEWLGIEFNSVIDLEGFENFVYASGSRVIRITHESHRSREQLLGELEFLTFLAEHDAPVARPVRLSNGEWLETIAPFHICQFERAPGTPAHDEPYSRSVIKEWGRCIGQFHRLATDFEPEHVRGDWSMDENHGFNTRIPEEQSLVRDKASQLMARLMNLPKEISVYGLIHSDAHSGNYLHDNGRLTFFDFDDCLHTWYGYDVATILLGVSLQPWVDASDAAMVDAVKHFLPVFLDGYANEYPVEKLMWDQMHDFLKLREFSLYGVIHAHMDPDNLQDWFPKKFMQGRQRRLQLDIPYLDMDFGQV